MQQRNALLQPERGGSGGWPRRYFVIGNSSRHNESMCYPLKGLSQDSRQPTSALYCSQACCGYPSGTQRRREQPACSDRVLHGQIDSHTADR